MKISTLQFVLSFLLLFGSSAVFAQTKEAPMKIKETEKPRSEEPKYSSLTTIEDVQLQIKEVSKELGNLGVASLPASPEIISLETLTVYLEELKVLKAHYTPINK